MSAQKIRMYKRTMGKFYIKNSWAFAIKVITQRERVKGGSHVRINDEQTESLNSKNKYLKKFSDITTIKLVLRALVNIH